MTTDTTKLKRWARWTATFIGFPMAGVAARAIAGNIDTATSAAIGGLVAGAVLGTVQAFIGGIDARERVGWIGATAAGLTAGLTLGASTVGYRTDTASLVVMGAVTGAAVGLAQAASIPMRRVDRLLWAVATPALWAGGWSITSQVIVDAHRQHAVFGSSGALAVSALAGVLIAVRQRPSGPHITLVGDPSDRLAA
jgi:hypothetical protein